MTEACDYVRRGVHSSVQKVVQDAFKMGQRAAGMTQGDVRKAFASELELQQAHIGKIQNTVEQFAQCEVRVAFTGSVSANRPVEKEVERGPVVPFGQAPVSEVTMAEPLALPPGLPPPTGVPPPVKVLLVLPDCPPCDDLVPKIMTDVMVLDASSEPGEILLERADAQGIDVTDVPTGILDLGDRLVKVADGNLKKFLGVTE